MINQCELPVPAPSIGDKTNKTIAGDTLGSQNYISPALFLKECKSENTSEDLYV